MRFAAFPCSLLLVVVMVVLVIGGGGGVWATLTPSPSKCWHCPGTKVCYGALVMCYSVCTGGGCLSISCVHGNATANGCACFPGWAPPSCSTCLDGSSGNNCQFSRDLTCSGNGMPTDDGGCDCDSGWTGLACQGVAMQVWMWVLVGAAGFAVLMFVVAMARCMRRRVHHASFPMEEVLLMQEQSTQPEQRFVLGWHSETSRSVRKGVNEDRVVAVHMGSTIIAAVLDGHGGSEASDFVQKELVSCVMSHLRNGERPEQALLLAFVELDVRILTSMDCVSGTCATVVMIHQGMMYCANAGDSRAVLCRGGQTVPLSEDHKPSSPNERTRLEKEGWPVFSGRVLGTLAVSRALGDRDLKEPRNGTVGDYVANPCATPTPVSAVPDVRRQPLTAKDEFVLIACDGFWDNISSEDAVTAVRSMIASEHIHAKTAGHNGTSTALMQGAKNLVKTVGQKSNFHDDTSVVIIAIV